MVTGALYGRDVSHAERCRLQLSHLADELETARRERRAADARSTQTLGEAASKVAELQGELIRLREELASVKSRNAELSEEVARLADDKE